jgi:threonine dehydratase
MNRPAERSLGYPTLAQAHRASSDVVRRTPILTATSISERCGGTIALKTENLQRTGSFKLRGALNKVRRMGPTLGVVAGSAGNHAQSLAYAARTQGVRCHVFMPTEAAVSKVTAVEAFGAHVDQRASSVDECVDLARRRAADDGLTFVHPYDDLDVIAGQAGVGVELIDDAPDLGMAIVPVGGGGLIAGVAAAVKQRRPDVQVIGVQAERCAPLAAAPQGADVAAPVATIADGIAIKRPGDITLPLVERFVDAMVTVTEEAVAEAMVLLLERSKLLVEGAGAAGLAALLSGAVRPALRGTTAVVISGGNVDIALVAALAARHETRQGRRLRLYTRVPDRPGGLAALLASVSATRANLLAVDHVRDGVALDVRETGIELTLETRGQGHSRAIVERLGRDGYEVQGAA